MTTIIDCDVHLPSPDPKVLLKYMPSHWTEYFADWQGTGNQLSAIYPPNSPTTMRAEVKATQRGRGIVLGGIVEKALTAAPEPAGATYFDLLRRDVLRPGVEAAIANCYTAFESIRHPFLAPDIARAVNDWAAAEWLDAEPRLRGSIVVTPLWPDLAAQEIERVAQKDKDNRFVQVFLPARSVEPYGNRRFWPIFEAAAKHDLVVCIHFGGIAGIPPTSSGWPSHYTEEYVGMATVFQSQVNSIVVSGLFEEYRNLRISLAEGGFSWMPTVMWQVDKRWKGLRRDIPWVKHAPSEYIREHMRATIQPADLPPTAEALNHLVDFIGSDDFLLYATDFPHTHTTHPDEVVAMLPEAMRPKVLSESARAFFPRLSLAPAAARG